MIKRFLCACFTFFVGLSSSPCLLATSSNSSSPVTPISSPTVRCSIISEDWCVARGPSSVSMIDLPYRQLWLITDPIGMQYGPLVIIFDKTCNRSDDHHVSFIGESKNKVAQSGELHGAVFNINDAGCQLKFNWPAGVARSYSYQEFMAYSVFVKSGAHGEYEPIYKFYGKYRCRGKFIDNKLKCK